MSAGVMPDRSTAGISLIQNDKANSIDALNLFIIASDIPLKS
jgi:hypothetical protein